MRLLIISHDRVGSRMAGPGIRYWELARALAAHGPVSLIAPQLIDLVTPGVTTGHYHWGNAASLAPWLSQADVILANGYLFEAHPELAQVAARRIIDLYDPTLLENIELLRDAPAAERDQRLRHDLALLGRQLAAGDHFLCATERQRDLYLGALLASGRVDATRVSNDPLLRNLIEVLPFGLPAEPPVRHGPGPRQLIPALGPDTPLILWHGGLWDWMDPLTLIEAMPAILARVPNARLLFLAGPHPGAARPRTPAQARARAEALGLLDQAIFFYDQWVPYAERANFLLEATLVVSLHRQHLETAYAALRSRVLDQLWVGLPGVLSAGDQAAELAREHGFSIVVPSEDAAAVATALITLLTDATLRASHAANARTLVAHFTWPRLIRPLLDWIAVEPARAARETSHVMDTAPTPPPQPLDVALVERSRLIQATRNAALQALDSTWRLDNLNSPARGLLGRLRRLLQDRVLWPLLYPLLARQQEQNAAVIRAFYANAEDHDQLRNLIGQQVRDFTAQLAALEESEVQLRALLRGEPAPPPREEP